MSEEMVNPVHDSPSASADGGRGSFEKDGGAKSFETEDEDDDGGIDFGASDEDAWLPGETVIDLDDEDVSYEDDDDIEAAWAAATHK